MLNNLLSLFILISVNFSFPAKSLALEIPTPTSPENNQTISTPSLIWNPVQGAIEYRVIVDDTNPPNSPYIKDYKTEKLKYTPTLPDGTYFWKLKAKDSNGNWTDWSQTFNFILSKNPTPNSKPENQSESKRDIFVISEIPQEINSSQTFSPKIELFLPSSPNTKFYLKAAFKKTDKNNYFGLTKVQDIWIKNGSSYSSQLPIETNQEGKWSGNIEVKVDSSDSGFTGTDTYNFKIARYSSSGDGPQWSNQLPIKITKDEEPDITPIPTPVITQIPSPVVKGIKTIRLSPKPASGSAAPNFTPPVATNSTKLSNKTNQKIKSLNESKNPFKNVLLLIGGALIFISISSIIYKKFKKRS